MSINKLSSQFLAMLIEPVGFLCLIIKLWSLQPFHATHALFLIDFNNVLSIRVCHPGPVDLK